jgi:hypothetical protein
MYTHYPETIIITLYKTYRGTVPSFNFNLKALENSSNNPQNEDLISLLAFKTLSQYSYFSKIIGTDL